MWFSGPPPEKEMIKLSSMRVQSSPRSISEFQYPRSYCADIPPFIIRPGWGCWRQALHMLVPHRHETMPTVQYIYIEGTFWAWHDDLETKLQILMQPRWSVTAARMPNTQTCEHVSNQFFRFIRCTRPALRLRPILSHVIDSSTNSKRKATEAIRVTSFANTCTLRWKNKTRAYIQMQEKTASLPSI